MIFVDFENQKKLLLDLMITTWELNGSQVALFAKELSEQFNIKINPFKGTIKANEDGQDVTLRFLLNNQNINVTSINYDDKQFFIRNNIEYRLRRISLRTICEVQYNGEVYIPSWKESVMLR